MQRLKPHPWMLKGCWVQTSPLTGSRHCPTKHFSHSLSLRQRTTMEGGQSRSAAPSYLAWSIFNTLCCCLPLGVAAIVCSCRVCNFFFLFSSSTASDLCILRHVIDQKLYITLFCNFTHFFFYLVNWIEFQLILVLILAFLKAQNANAVGESAVAQDASRTAKILNIVGLVCGIILIIIVIALKATQHWGCQFFAYRCLEFQQSFCYNELPLLHT